MIPSVIYQALSNAAGISAVGGRIYRDYAGDAPAAPYIVWSLLAGVPENNLSDTPPGDRWSVSVDVFAKTEQQSDTLTFAARDAMETIGHVLTIQSLGRESTGTWRYSFDVDIHKPR